mgnify:CR=1 FL=1
MKTIENYKKNLNLLYIEDDPVISKKIKTILEKFFNKVLIANEGEEAFKIYENNKIDLIISDINMPKMNGLQFLELLRKKSPDIPFIFVTAREDPNMMLKAIQLDIDNYILKPIDLKDFLNIINNACEKLYRKSIKEEEKNIIKIDEKVFWNKENRILTQNDQICKLTKKELLILDLLLKSKNKTYPVNEIINHLWLDDFKEKDYISCLKNIISRLRMKMPQINIENIYGMGYRINLHK